MTEKLQELISALREELQQYGEMLARLDYHQDLVVHRRAENLLESVTEIEAQGKVVQSARDRRELCRQDLAAAMNLPRGTSFSELSSQLPNAYRPLISALVQENNELLVRIHQRSRQNHLLLKRTLELMQRFMSTLFPGHGSPVYNGNGRVLKPVMTGRRIYDAMG